MEQQEKRMEGEPPMGESMVAAADEVRKPGKDDFWVYLDPSVPVRQGDLLQTPGGPGLAAQERCLVITADCDIKQQKYGQFLVCLRIVTLESWFKHYWAESCLQETQGKRLVELCKQVGAQARKHYGGEAFNLTGESLVAWLNRVGPGGIAEELSVSPEDRERWIRPLDNMHRALDVLERLADASPLKRLTHFRATALTMDLEKVQGVVRSEMDQKANRLPEDVFLLPWMPEPETGPALVLLREVVGVQEEAIRYRRSEALHEGCRLRVARLTETLKYSLSQAYGHLFSKIGIPEEIETYRKLAAGNAQHISLE